MNRTLPCVHVPANKHLKKNLLPLFLDFALQPDFLNNREL